ncbi:D-alanine--D-alanine ligase family protein [Jannaschia ovalis]|uniref:ATP-grasp domain-containing protein n=1 Tax=Jannaschia ovalis TaxID=3038773 RepID=A0ABY8LAN0_9RHOB|nr:hypothetical protein [Jannaschia sp. GRR-S6-38]WGH78384.1 hypothetical protein P8627_15375 [Jannaschia sp. GRR-S6-38]
MRVLHVAGATTTRFYRDLSLTYQRNVVRPKGVRTALMTVEPDGRIGWDGRDLPRSAALELAAGFDLVVPHMFCKPGMTAWRSLFETVLDVPVVGPPLAATVTATSKLATKALAREAGLRTAASERLIPGAPVPRMDLPVVVKPDSEDNSLGLTLVRDAADLPAAIAHALAHDEVALAEAFIPGREVRVGVIEDPVPRVLPVLEYHVSDAHPIRERADKVALDEGGAVTMGAWERPSLATTCPAELAPGLHGALAEAALTMHAALGSRDYSLFDFRIHAETGQPYLLEACSFWTFTPVSVISRMLEAEGSDLEAVALRIWARAAARKQKGPRQPGTAPLLVS